MSIKNKINMSNTIPLHAKPRYIDTAWGKINKCVN